MKGFNLMTLLTVAVGSMIGAYVAKRFNLV